MESARRRYSWLWAACSCLWAATMWVPVAARADDADVIAKACPAFAAWERQQALADQGAEQPGAAGTDWRVRAQLLGMAMEDQEAREAAFNSGGHRDPKAVDEISAVDARNLAALQEIVAVGGVPVVQSVGRRGVSALWVLVQHADADTDLQEKVLQSLSADSGIPREQIAVLTDRVRVRQGRPQLYGTQFQVSGTDLVPDPIEDAPHVDQRRRDMGLPPLADYTCAMRATYKLPGK